MLRRKINPVVVFVVLTLVAFVVVFWATWSALQHHAAAPPAGVAAKDPTFELLAVLSWVITAGYGVWLAATGRKFGNVPRRITGRPLRLYGVVEAVISLLAIWAILSQPANTFLYTFGSGAGILTVAIAAMAAIRSRRVGASRSR